METRPITTHIATWAAHSALTRGAACEAESVRLRDDRLATMSRACPVFAKFHPDRRMSRNQLQCNT